MQGQKTYGLLSRVLYRGKIGLDWLGETYSRYILYKLSRVTAKRIRKIIINDCGNKIVSSQELKRIKEYCGDTFGDTTYWPWLALYTELRGEFKEGWIPDDYYRFELLPKLNPDRYTRLSEAKSIDHTLFGDKIEKPLFYRLNGQYIARNGSIITEKALKQHIIDINKEVIIKPDIGRGGHGIHFFHPQNFKLEELPHEQDLVFYSVVEQHAELSKLHPSSINTFRVVTHLTPVGDIHILYVILRFGLGGSRVDNASSGGGCVYIHKDGKIGPFAYNSLGQNIGCKHPDTGKVYAELELPFYDKIITLCERAHHSFPFTRLIGWDVYINEKGKPKLIEWNANNPGTWNEEALFGPLFKDLIKK